MSSRIRTGLLATVLAVGLLPAGAPAAPSEDGYSSPTVEHVTNLQFSERPDLGESIRLATDVDFLSYSVPADFSPPAGLPDHLTPSPGETRELAIVGTQVNGMQVVDITDPTRPGVVAVYECAVAQADVWLFERDDLGKTFVAYSSDIIPNQHNFSSRCHTDNRDYGARAGRYGTFLIDVTNPYDPQSVSFVPVERGSHQVAVHPSGEWLYSASSSRQPATGGGARVGQIDLIDISDPAAPGAPTFVPFLTGADAHDLSFSADGSRAYVAALTHAVILDTSDPGNPSVVGQVVDPAVETAHDAFSYELDDRAYLFVTDELLGAAGNGFCPGGGLHVYDITGELERSPVKVGAYFAPEVTVQEGGRGGTGGLVRCTAHVPQIHADAQLMTIAWFGAGVRVLDLSGLAGVTAGVTPDAAVQTGIREVGFHRFDDSDVWAAKTNHIAEDGSFYLYGIDTVRHFDVFRFTPDAVAEGDGGDWLGPEEALARAQRMRLPDPTAEQASYCRL